jgi:hypothetical protein|tara:strand:+ start:19479 stop:20405 length:927 start_codon:yes stop_codon:yes gene_type:complete
MSRGHKKVANYTEDLVGFALESFLSVISFPRQRFSIEPFSRGRERWLGADARLFSNIRGFRPFYMQFKRPCAYPDFSRARFVKDRQKLGLEASPHSLYFDLRDKQASHNDYQHNILLRLHQKLQSRGIGDAAYVCPLFLDRAAYRFHLQMSGLSLWPRFWRQYPYELEDILLWDSGRTLSFDRFPVLAEHITVPPHASVTNARHRYSFTENGTELCFHSPEALPGGASNLAKFLSYITRDFFADGEKIRPENASQALKEIIAATEVRPQDGIYLDSADDDAIGNWFAWGDYLRTEYEIEQYALVSWRD